MKVFASTIQRALHVALASTPHRREFKSVEAASWEALMDALTKGQPIEIDNSSRYDIGGDLVNKPTA